VKLQLSFCEGPTYREQRFIETSLKLHRLFMTLQIRADYYRRATEGWRWITPSVIRLQREAALEVGQWLNWREAKEMLRAEK
jgi:hypothetical protein